MTLVGLVPIDRPSVFNWPGPWLALLRTAGARGQVAAVAYGAPPGIAWHPLGGPESFEAIEAGYLVARLEGDRYFEARGTFTSAHSRGHDLTLIEAEVLDELSFPSGRLAPEEARRNIITRGVDLGALVGRRFRVGAVDCFGQRLCEPCAHLERLTASAGKPGTLRALIHKGGLRADILTDGEIAVGDPITGS